MKLQETHKYDDIIHLSRPVSPRRSRMTNYDRAAQFSPFAALTGYDAVIEETARLTDSRIELEEGRKEELNDALLHIRERLGEAPRVRLTYFCYDERKAGGAYVTAAGQVKKLDDHSRSILLTDGRAIPIDEVIDIEIG